MSAVGEFMFFVVILLAVVGLAALVAAFVLDAASAWRRWTGRK